MPSLLARWMDSEHQERDVRILTAKIDTTSSMFLTIMPVLLELSPCIETVDSEGKITDRWPSLKTVWFMRIEAPKTPREHGAVFTLTMGVCTPTHQRISNDPYLATTPYNRAHKTARHYLCARCIHHLQHLRYLVPRCLDYLLNTLWWQVQ